MMETWTVKMTAVLLGHDGEPLKDGFGSDKSDLTLGDACSYGVAIALETDRGIDWKKRWAWDALIRRVRGSPAAELTHAEAKLLLDRVGTVYALANNGGAVIFAAASLLDPNMKPPEIG